MASESESSSLLSRNRALSLFLPFILSNSVQDSSNPDQETGESTTPSDQFSDRIILVNPLTQSMFVFETRSSSSFDSLLSGLINKYGQPPASKASIEGLPIVEICEESEKGECAVCLDELGVGGVVKEMPCKHRFHGDCVEKWLKIHGSCPICRYKMPEEEEGENKSENGRRRREIWMSVSVGSDGRSSAENHQTVSADSTSENDHDHHDHAPEV